jgi:anti-anti-sigma factor
VTAFPAVQPYLLHLVCDSCGHSLNGINSSMRDWHVVWALVSEQGWTGSPLSMGPCRCPECSPPPTLEPDVNATRPPIGTKPEIFGTITIIELYGDLDLAIGEDLHAFLSAAQRGCRGLVLDLTRITMVDPAGLAVLARTSQSISRLNGALCLVHPPTAVVQLLRRSGTRPLLPVFHTRVAALAWLRRNRYTGSR